MADKPILTYRIDAVQNPADRTKTLFVPRLTERANTTTSLQNIVENAIDRGLIAGLKPSAAAGIADALAQQMYKEFSNGKNIQFGSYFYGQLFLDGTVKTMVGPLTDANKLNIRLYKGRDFRLDRGDFTMQLDTDLVAPSIVEVIGSDNIAGHVVNGSAFNVVGRNFGATQGSGTVSVSYVDGEGATQSVAATVNSWGPDNINATATLSGVAAGTALTVTVAVVSGDTTLTASAGAESIEG